MRRGWACIPTEHGKKRHKMEIEREKMGVKKDTSGGGTKALLRVRLNLTTPLYGYPWTMDKEEGAAAAPYTP